ncbi:MULTISPECIES: hypothetical protein [Parachlamydia]|uniref:hypothetical protein n=1 Tax=Parachlamydia TaxID=83551 RepID=UPI00057CBB62|nr:hypothetical protein [Parachlamydia acanthamoebae]
MFKLIFCFFFLYPLYILPFHGGEVIPAWENTFQKLSNEEKCILDVFFKRMITESEGGYVLYGSKPACSEGIFDRKKSQVNWIGNKNHQNSVELAEGYRVWKKYFASIASKNLIICLKDHPDSLYDAWHQLFWVNPRKLQEVISDHLALFRYSLGPHVTPSSFLNFMIDPSQDFLHDYVLIGIILGFGSFNSLSYQRLEIIEKDLCSREMPPYQAKSERLNFPNRFQNVYLGFDKVTAEKAPLSFNYSTLAEEYELLFSRSFSSRKKSSEIPLFAIFHEDEETTNIVSSYEKDRLKIQNLLSQSDFLEQVLKVIFE